MATIPYSVSLDDIDASRDELEALRDVMRRDEPFPDEPPVWESIDPPAEPNAALASLLGPLTPALLMALGWVED